MEAGVGVNSPEFLQTKIERLKKALDEANVLMDRQVTERDDARAQLDTVKRENDELRRELEQLRAQVAQAPAPEPAEEAEQPIGLDPELEQSLRDRIAQLEGERETLQANASAAAAAADSGAAEADAALRERVDSLQSQLDAANQELEASKRDLESSKRDLESSKSDLENARAAADSARRESQQAQQAIAAGAQRRPMNESELPAPGPFVSQEVIRDALDNDNFILFCQPVFSLQAERITQYELLLRLRDDDGRMVRPFGFLEPADRFGLMGEIDRWVVRHALELLERDVSGELRLEVNIAAQSLNDYELTSLIEQHIAVTDLDPGRLILEVSENVAAANLDDCKRMAKMLRGMGCGFALDDFGSTFASFRHLRDLPINFLKIDGDLVVSVTESRSAALTIKSLVELAKGIGADTIAEYVSDDQTLEFLREQGVGYAQGYRIGRPRPIEEVLDMHGTHEAQPAPPTRVERPALASGGEEDEPQQAAPAPQPPAPEPQQAAPEPEPEPSYEQPQPSYEQQHEHDQY